MLRAVAIALFLTSSPAPAAPVAPADLVLHHGIVLTVDDEDRVARGIAVSGGRIVAVGTDAEVDRLIGKATKVVDLAGHTVTPGLIDTHAHLLETGTDELVMVDLTGATSVAAILAAVKARADATPPGEWVQGFGWNEGVIAEHRPPTRAELDGVSGDHPVDLVNITHHYLQTNSAALARVGVGMATPDPDGGTIVRDDDGKPTGLLRERAQNLVFDRLPKLTVAQYRQALQTMVARMHAEGMTGVKDPALNADYWLPLVDIARAQGLPVHLCALIFAGNTMDSARAALQLIEDGKRSAATLPGHDLQMCGAKIILDGSAAGRTAWRYEDYEPDARRPGPAGRGYPIVQPEVYREMVSLFNRAQVSIGTHAIGDRAIDLVVDAYAAALAEAPAPGLRHSIIHAHEPTEHALEQMAALQKRYDAAIPEVQAEFLWTLGDVLPGAFGPERSKHLMPLATYLKRGILFTSGSDFGVTPLPARYGLWASVARAPLKGIYGPHPFGLEEAVDVHVALRSYTRWAARQIFLEKGTGSLEVGKLADLAVWDRNPYAVPTSELKDMLCLMTFYKGKKVFERR